jgi:ferredoxin
VHHLRRLYQSLSGRLITKKDFPVPIENGLELCIDCDYCVAICPTGAMQQRTMNPEDIETNRTGD